MNMFYKVKWAALVILITSVNSCFAQSGHVFTVAGGEWPGSTGDGGPASAATLSTVYGIALDNAANICVTDFAGSVVRKIDVATGAINTIAGNPTVAPFSADGGPATAEGIFPPTGVAVDKVGNMFITAHDFRIRKVDVFGIITTIAGNPTTGSIAEGIPATAAWIGIPQGIAVDTAGDLYVGCSSAVRKIDKYGIINTIAGSTTSSGYSGDGGLATAALLYLPVGLALDDKGNLYVSCNDNRIRKINTSGIISTIAGTGTAGYTGDGGPAISATVNSPRGIAFDNAGNLLFSDYYNQVIRMIDGSGTISTFAGVGPKDPCYLGEGTWKDTTCIFPQLQLAFDPHGTLYFGNANRVSKIMPVLATTKINALAKQTDFSIIPNPGCNEINIKTNASTIGLFQIANSIGQLLVERIEKGCELTIDISNLPSGVYFITSVGEGQRVIKRFVKL